MLLKLKVFFYQLTKCNEWTQRNSKSSQYLMRPANAFITSKILYYHLWEFIVTLSTVLLQSNSGATQTAHLTDGTSWWARICLYFFGILDTRNPDKIYNSKLARNFCHTSLLPAQAICLLVQPFPKFDSSVQDQSKLMAGQRTNRGGRGQTERVEDCIYKKLGWYKGKR